MTSRRQEHKQPPTIHMEPIHQGLVDAAVVTVQAILSDGNEVLPQLVILTGDDTVEIIVVSQELMADKTMVAETLRLEVAERQAKATVFMVETWLYSKDANVPDLMRQGIMPSQSQGRRDGLSIILETPGRYVIGSAEVFQKADRREMEPISWSEQPAGGMSMGRFMNLLPANQTIMQEETIQ